ncbi:DUF4184 family protein [Microbacterium sp. NPDC089189]|uniref:DUF4184 family protein n=1 Tax=Microbacterium sp. NPDC089189 TaxID=3154972 RepID=UPI00343A9EB7
MPFTPSHAVVALPFLRTRLVPAAIAIGAMTPDLPLFVRGTPLSYGHTHDLAWIVPTAVVALVLLLVWRALLRPAVRELSPLWLAARLPRAWDAGARAAWRETFSGGWVGALLLAASLLLGVLSHIAWDAFTHEGRGGLVLWPALAEPWGPMLGFKWLQHGSSAFGLLVIAVWAALWLRRRAVAPVERVTPPAVRVVWWLSLPVVLAIAWVGGLVVFGGLTPTFTVAHLAYRVLPPACALWGVLTLVLCVIIAARRRPAPSA